jgi:hypothetical protein
MVPLLVDVAEAVVVSLQVEVPRESMMTVIPVPWAGA